MFQTEEPGLSPRLLRPSIQCQATLRARIFGDPLRRAASIRFRVPSVRMRAFRSASSLICVASSLRLPRQFPCCPPDKDSLASEFVCIVWDNRCVHNLQLVVKRLLSLKLGFLPRMLRKSASRKCFVRWEIRVPFRARRARTSRTSALVRQAASRS